MEAGFGHAERIEDAPTQEGIVEAIRKIGSRRIVEAVRKIGSWRISAPPS